MAETPEKALAQLISELEAATREYESAERAENLARTTETNAVNRLNRAQAAVDAHLEGLRGKAPNRSDWSSARRRKEAVPCG